MAIDYQALLATRIADGEQHYGEGEASLYALALGLCADPTDRADLAYLLGPNPAVLPGFACVLAHPGHWMSEPATGIDYRRVLHVYQRLECHAPLTANGHVTSRSRVRDIFDKGTGKGALILAERVLYDEAGKALATLVNGSLCRADGGFGGPVGGPGRPEPMPERAPDTTFDSPTLAQAALLYRLLGDRNPIHGDPEAARDAGFDRPILHGLATFGIAAHALVSRCCGGDPERLAMIECSFSSPAYPGETLRTEIWRDGNGAHFRTGAIDRDEVVLSGGSAAFR
jgi:acyl dehydratase